MGRGSAGTVSPRGAGQVLARAVAGGQISQNAANRFAERINRGIARGGITSGAQATRLAREFVRR